MDDAERRAILREQGEEPPKKGKLGPDWVARADEIKAKITGAPAYDGGVTDADFADTTAAAEPEPAPVLPAERKPRAIRTPAPSLRERFTRKPKAGAKKSTTAKKKLPRLSLAPLIGEVWGVMGGLAGRVDVPLGRCLQMQAPVAGEILEDVVRGTIVDTALQPVARAEDKAKAVGALVLPPALVVFIEHAQTLPDDQRKMREAFAWPMLVQSLMMYERIAGDKMAQMAERIELDAGAMERAENAARLIFAMAAPAAAPEPETVGV